MKGRAKTPGEPMKRSYKEWFAGPCPMRNKNPKSKLMPLSLWHDIEWVNHLLKTINRQDVECYGRIKGVRRHYYLIRERTNSGS